MGLSSQQSDSPKPLSFPPQLAARWDSLVRRRDLLSGDSREMKFDLRESVVVSIQSVLGSRTHLLENM